MKKKRGDPIRYDRTKAGEQGVVITEQRTQEYIGAKRSGIPLSEQIKGTMFDPDLSGEEPDIFPKKEE